MNDRTQRPATPQEIAQHHLDPGAVVNPPRVPSRQEVASWPRQYGKSEAADLAAARAEADAFVAANPSGYHLEPEVIAAMGFNPYDPALNASSYDPAAVAANNAKPGHPMFAPPPVAAYVPRVPTKWDPFNPSDAGTIALAAELAGFTPEPLNLWHGLDEWSETDQATHARRVELLWEARAATSTGVVLLPGFEEIDWIGRGSVVDLEPREARRHAFFLADAATAHEARHWFYAHPFCGLCRPREDAAASLVRWVVLNPGKTPRDRWDGVTLPEPVREVATAEERKVWYSLEDLAKMPRIEWLVEGLVPWSGIGYIVGRDGVKKTFLALDLALSLTTGAIFHGRALHENAVGGAIFVAGEGAHSVGARCEAWAAYHGREWTPTDQALFSVHAGAVNLYRGGAGYEALLAEVKHRLPDLVVLDTLQRCTEGADQNSAADMAVVGARLDELKRAGGDCVILVIAHTDKGDNDARGSSAIEDDADFVIHVKDRDNIVEARVTKQKDGPVGSTLRLVGEAHAGSIALVAADEARVAEAHAGSSVRLRIINALRLAHGERLTAKEVHASVTTRQAPAAFGTVRNTLGTMADAGEIHREQKGEGQRAYFWLEPTDALAGVGMPEE